MPSKDPVAEGVNDWMEKSPDPQIREYFARARQRAINKAGLGRAASRTEPSGLLTRLARRAGKDPEELAEKIPADTLRRTKYAVIEEIQADGKVLYKHPKV